jgi:hypothetical protein
MSAATIAMLISVVASLFLAVRAMRAHGVSPRNKAVMALAWVAIIVVVAFLFSRITA